MTPDVENDQSREEAIDRALARAVVFRVLKLGFQVPTDDFTGQVASAEACEALRHACRLLDSENSHALPEAGDSLLGLSPATRESHNRLFGHTSRGPICPYETEYGGDDLFTQAQVLADIAGYVLAFGLQPRSGASERVDHIAVECEYLEFLSQKEACVLARGDGETLQETRKAYRWFFKDHLGGFAPAFASKVLEADRQGYYGGLACLLRALLSLESERLGVRLGPEFLKLRSGSLDDAPMACGSSSELVQIAE